MIILSISLYLIGAYITGKFLEDYTDFTTRSERTEFLACVSFWPIVALIIFLKGK